MHRRRAALKLVHQTGSRAEWACATFHPTFGRPAQQAYTRTSKRATKAMITQPLRWRATLSALFVALFLLAQASAAGSACAIAMPDCGQGQAACSACDAIGGPGCWSGSAQIPRSLISDRTNALPLVGLALVGGLFVPSRTPRRRSSVRLRSRRVAGPPAYVSFCRLLE